MKRETYSASLKRLCRAVGVVPTYQGMGGQYAASPEAVCKVLSLLGVPIEQPDAAGEALRAVQAGFGTVPWAEPAFVVWGGRRPKVWLHGLTGQFSGAHYALTVRLEDGSRQERTGRLPRKLSASTHRERPGLGCALDLGSALPFGRHQVTLHVLGLSDPLSTWVLSAPERCFERSDRLAWALFAPTYALWSRDGPGASLYELEVLARQVGRRGGAFLGTLPLLATYPEEPSPYAPVSRRFYNELYLDLSALPELGGGGKLARELEDVLRELRALSQAPLVDYARRTQVLRPFLSRAAEAFFRNHGAERDPFEAWLQQHPRAADYAAFRATIEKQGRGFRNWEPRLRDGVLSDQDGSAEARKYHLYVQYRLHQQLTGLQTRLNQEGIGLYLDLPVGVHGDGYDVWRERASFLEGASAGAPPDAFFLKGQNWGFAPLNPRTVRADGHQYFAESLAAQLRYAKALRIDHVMGLHRMFVIPHGAGPEDGVYVRYPSEELYATMCIESQRAQAVIVGENLGTVPPEVPREMRRRGLSGMYLGLFSVTPGAERGIAAVPRGAVASLNTHDTATFAGYCAGDDIDERLALGLIDEREAGRGRRARKAELQALWDYLSTRRLVPARKPRAPLDLQALLQGWLVELSRSPAFMVLINVEDVWLERAPQNVPGTHLERPNWRRRLRHGVEEIAELPALRSLIDRVAQARAHRQKGRRT